MATTTCPNCGGTNVEEFRAIWVNPNTGEQDDSYGIANAYPFVFWCNDCQDHPSTLIEKEASE